MSMTEFGLNVNHFLESTNFLLLQKKKNKKKMATSLLSVLTASFIQFFCLLFLGENSNWKFKLISKVRGITY